MPQMAPIWWFSLFMVFILTYYIFMMFMYFYNIYQLKKENSEKTILIKNNNWKW